MCIRDRCAGLASDLIRQIYRIALRSEFKMRLCGSIFIVITIYVRIIEILVHITRQYVLSEFPGLSIVYAGKGTAEMIYVIIFLSLIHS